MTPLHWAAARGCADVVRMLAHQPGVDVNAQDGCTMTPLHWAAHQGHPFVLLVSPWCACCLVACIGCGSSCSPSPALSSDSIA